MNVHVPQAGDQIAPLALDRPLGSPTLRNSGVGTDRDDIVALEHHRLPRNRLRRFDVDDRDVANDGIALFRRGEHRRRSGEQGESRSEEHTSELQSLMRISYAVFCLKKKKKKLQK